MEKNSTGREGKPATLLKTHVSQAQMFFPLRSLQHVRTTFSFISFSIHIGLPLLYSIPFILTSRGHGLGNLAANMSLTLRASGSVNVGQFSCL